MDPALLNLFLAIDINVDPTMLELGFTLTWHGFFTAVGIVAGLVLGLWLARRDGIAPEVGQELALVSVPAGIVGARLFYVIEHWNDFVPGNMSDIVFGITDGGLTLYGALICGAAAGALYALWQRWPVGVALDAAAPAIILGVAIGRFGDVLSGQRLATDSGLPWAVRYTHPDTLGDLGVAVHPATAYELLGGLAIFAVLLFVLRPRVQRAGWVFCSFVAMYAVLRFVLAHFRAGEQTVGDIAVTQIVSAVLLGMAFLVAGVFYRRPGPITEEWAQRVGVAAVEDEPPPEQPRKRKKKAVRS